MYNTEPCFIKVKKNEIEVELHGPKSFIDEYKTILFEMIPEFEDYKEPKEQIKLAAKLLTVEDYLDADFVSLLPIILKIEQPVVKFLITGYHLQRKNKDNFFQVTEVFNLLYSKGILLENILEYVEHALKHHTIVKVGMLNKKPKFRLSENSILNVHALLKSSIEFL